MRPRTGLRRAGRSGSRRSPRNSSSVVVGTVDQVSAPLVVCVGLCVFDVILTVDEVPSAPAKYFAHTSMESAGGPAATAAAAITRLGGRARFVGRVGDDSRGDRLRSMLEAAGIEVAVESIAGLSTPVSVVLVTPDGERTIVNHTDPGLFVTPPPAKAFAGGGVVLADVRWPDGATAAMDHASTAGIPGVLDLDLAPVADIEGIRPATRSASHVVASQAGLAPFASGDVAPFDGWLAVTAGAEGVDWPGGRIVPPPVRAVETLGAGDVFHGAFALALAEGHTEEHALRFASAAAAVKCSRTGGWSALGDRPEVEALMEETWSPHPGSSGG